jgi:predicted phage baseplate assembly protein
VVPDDGPYRPLLPDIGLAFAQPYAHQDFIDAGGSARAALVQDTRLAVPSGMSLVADDPTQFGDQPDPAAVPWNTTSDLLACDRFTQAFLVETEHDGSAWLRFGDDQFGVSPDSGQRLLASYRIGGGTPGNVGADAISAVVTDDPTLRSGLLTVRNPLPAQGGEDPESADSIKRFAPEAFRTQERAVTMDDHARMAELHPEVQRAVAQLRWTGSWYTAFLVIDRFGGLPVDDAFKQSLLAHMERYRLTGYDLEIVGPVYVPLDIELGICVLPSYFAANVQQQLLRRFGTTPDAQGRPGFFDPDAFSFGDALPLSAVFAAAMAVPGVASVDVSVFQRWGRTPAGEIAAGILRAAPLEVLRLDNDPNFPENGRLVLTMKGGT